MTGPPSYFAILQSDVTTSSAERKRKRDVREKSAASKEPLAEASNPASSPREVEVHVPTPPRTVVNLDAEEAEVPPSRPIGYSKSAIWSVGVTPELRTPLRPADRWLEGRLLSKDEITELEEVEAGCLKAASMLRGYTHFRNEYAILAEAYLKLEAEKKQVVTERDSALAEKDEATKEKATLATRISALTQDLAKAKTDLDAAVKEVGLQKDAASSAEKKFADSAAEVERCKVELKNAVFASHTHTLDLVKFLNPDVTINLAGIHPLAYVEDGKLVSPAEVSETFVDGGVEDHGEEVGSGVAAADGEAQLTSTDAAV